MSEIAQQEWADDEINLPEYWRVIQKRRLMILGLVFVCVFTSGFYNYFIATKIYESKTTILGPKESTGGGAGLATLLGASSAGQLLAGLIQGGGTSRDTFIAILKSQTLAEELVNRFKLKEYYRSHYLEQAIRALKDVTDITVSKEGVISITVADKDPRLAADIANAYVSQLDRVFVKMGTTEASRQRAFITERLEQTERNLRKSEQALRQFQERNRTLALPDQARAPLEAAAKVRGEIVANEVFLESMLTYATPSNPTVLAQKARVDELKRQLAQMQYGKGLELPNEARVSGEERKEFQSPIASAPALGMELLRLTRDVKIQEAVFTFLNQQYETAKIQEAKDTPTVQVLDRAVPAELKSRPKTVLSMVISGTLSLFVGIVLAFFLEYLARVRHKQSAPV